ncbi:MAG TPA: SDR family NAD(P)-dependent oxidoreductase [Spongiibacteraceae bacterium]|nr:SDR family NAD(P)-dependent oxidoreductase [Spongiibacteraceae bacterium]
MSEFKRVALVTGGGVGMGAATCIRFARDGMRVGVLDINGDAAEATAKKINEAGGRAFAVVADVSDRAQIESAVAKVRSTLGPITVLVNNAGIENFSAFEQIKDDVWDRLMDVNLKGAYMVTQTVLPDMLECGWGRIINIASFAAQLGAPTMVHYSATKGGTIAMTRSLALELGRRGITVNSISPGFIDTPMARRAIDGGKFPLPLEDMLKSYPIPRLGLPEEIAAACAFFASEDAGYITGQLLGVNGGTAV